MDEWTKIKQSAAAFKKAGMSGAGLGIILGTGLGSFAKALTNPKSLAYEDCPHFPKATAFGHAGRALFGTLKGKKVLVMDGRFHHYEGYSLREVTYPVRVMKELGIRTLILSNAAGGLNPQFKLADIMVISDHINLIGDSPLAGPNDERLGPRFPDLSRCYSKRLIEAAEKAALKLKMPLQKGVYVAVKGPNLETGAEYRFLRLIGSDAVGMSTVPEVIVAAHAGLEVIAFSCVTDMCLPDALEPADIQKILKTAAEAEPKLTKLVSELIATLPARTAKASH